MEKQDAIAVLAALAHETRLDVFRLLVRNGAGGMSAGAIARSLDVPAATLSFHLKELKACGAIECERDGRTLNYTPSFETMNEMVAYLSENCCSDAGGCAPAATSNV